MNAKDLLLIATAALGTATVTVTLFWSGSLSAGNEAQSLQAKISKPALVARGVALTLAAASAQTPQAGDQPVLKLTAVNTNPVGARVPLRIVMSSSSPNDALSRVPRLPATLWQQSQLLTLRSNETKTITIVTQTELPTNAVISVYLLESELNEMATGIATNRSSILPTRASLPTGIVALEFSTANPARQTLAAK